MDRRDFLGKLALGLPVAGIGGAALLKSGEAKATTTYQPIYVATDYGTDATSIASAISDAITNANGLIFESGIVFRPSNIVFNGSTGFPKFMLGYGASLNPAVGTTGTFIEISGGGRFKFAGFQIDTTGMTTGLSITNSSFSTYEDLEISGTLSGSGSVIEIIGDSSSGSMTNTMFRNIDCLNSATGYGFNVTTISGAQSDNYDNTFMNCYSGVSGNTGWNIDLANNAYINCTASGSIGFNIDRTTYSQFIGGSSGGGGATSFALTSNSKGIVVMGSGHSGAITGNSHTAGNTFLINDGVNTPFAYGPDGQVHVGMLTVTGSIGNTHTPSGGTARAVPIYSNGGTLLGYMPVYGSLW